jgi:transcriptional regulator with XRE-family HTH domain
MEVTSIGDRIAEARKVKGLSQSQVAEKTGYSKNTICRLEKSHSVADVKQITKIGDALKCDLLWLLNGSESIKQHTGGTTPVFRTSKVRDQSPSASDAESQLDFPGLGDCDFAVINDSSAMTPRFMEGCLLAIKVCPVEDGQVAAIIDEWGAFQVRWQRCIDGKVFFVAENQQYPPIPEAKVKMIGRVLAGLQANFY